MERTVKIHNEDITISVYQTSKSVWVASGTYMDQSFQTKGRTSSSAVKLWIDAARYKGN